MAFLEDADARRDLRRDGSTTCFREVHGAADGAPPNLAVDRYGSHLLVQRPEEVSERARDEVLDGLAQREPFEGVYEIVTRTDRSHGGQGAAALAGAPAPDGRRRRARLLLPGQDKGDSTSLQRSFHVELGEAKLSTGLFLDQRPQRAWLARHAENRTVLNLFAHAGAYSVAAALGGASRTLSVDCDRKWLAYEAKSLAYNGVANPTVDVGGRPFPKHDAIYGDCFGVAAAARESGETFDVVMLDPPSTSTVNGKRWSAQRDYGALAALCAPS
ncbi:S-adenosylmethionine-dependent methyltransferase [Aureococcus anophagefferens]|nr:S-adenosylmethionine-dependent methyltransferase [Aureococcus anophagefferens]